MPAFITTFYSYKGGVGRTLLAANIAYLLAQQEKTLIWDMDIEAPGLHHIPALKPLSGIAPKSGFLDWLHGNPPVAAVDITPKALAAFLQLPYCVSSIQPNLYVMPAMGSATELATLYKTIDWLDCLSVQASTLGFELLTRLLTALGEQGFKHIIFDSRTGITDIGGLLAGALPHMTVLVGGYGVQNTKGLAGVWSGLQRAVRERNLKRLLVASPIPTGDIERLTIGEQVWSEAFDPKPEASIIKVPFDQTLLFGEQLLANTQPDGIVAKSYRAIHDQVQAAYEEWLAMAASDANERAVHADPSFASATKPSTTAKGKTFEDRVAHLLRLLGYEVEREQLVDSNRVDLIARKRGDFGKSETYLVECKDLAAAVPKDVIDKLAVWVSQPTAKQWQANGMVIAASGFSPQALGSAKLSGITALSFDELERSLFDFAPYLRRLRQRYEASPLARFYVDQQVMVGMQGEAQELLPYAQAWATGQGRRLWLLLGDYGTGKSSFVQRFAYELATSCASNPNAPIPLAIDLKLFPNVISLEQLIQEHLKTEVQAVLNPEIVLHLFSAGRVVLLLDSFDEMGVAQIGRAVEEQFRKLASATARAGEMFDVVRALDLDDDGADDVFDHGAPWRRLEGSFARAQTGSRMLITSRSHFFKDSSATENAANPQDSLFAAAGDSLLGKAARSFEAQIDEVPTFTPGQIAEYLTKRLGAAQGAQALSKINQLTGGAELAAVPQLLDIMVQSLPELMKQGGAVNQATLYLSFTNKWLDGFRLQHGEIAPEQMRLLLEQVACALWAKPQNRIHYSELPELLKQHPGLMHGLDPVRVDLELRTASFLVRSPDGFYRFSHRSFLEFFYVRAILRGLGAGKAEGGWNAALSAGPLSPAAVSFLLDFVRVNAALMATVQAAITQTLESSYVPVASENAVRIALASSFQLSLPRSAEKRAQLAGANLQGFDFNNQVLCADLSGANCSGANFSLATLNGSLLKQANFSDASLRTAKLGLVDAQGAQFVNIDGAQMAAQSGRFRGARFNGAQLGDANFTSSDCAGADFSAANLADTRFGQTDLSNALFGAAIAPGAIGLPIAVATLPRDKQTRHLSGHGGLARACAYAPDSKTVLTAGDDGTARLWDTASGRELRQLSGHDRVYACAYAPDGKTVLTAGRDGTARLWDAASGRELRALVGHKGGVIACAYAPDCKTVLTGGSDGMALLWDVASGRELRQLPGPKGDVHAWAFALDSKTLLTVGDGATVLVWDAASGRELRRLAGHEGLVRAGACAPDGKTVLTAGDDGTVRLWDAASGRELRTLVGHKGSVRACAYAPDSKTVLTAGNDGVARLWDAASGRELRQLAGHKDYVFACAYAPDGKTVLTAGRDGAARLWDAVSGRELRALVGPKEWVRACSVAPDGRSVLTGGSGGTARLWDAVSGRELRKLAAHKGWVLACAVAPDSKTVLTTSDDGTARLWDAASGHELRIFSGHNGWVLACTYGPEGKTVLTVGADGTARLWDAASGRELWHVVGHRDEINDCAFAPDGKTVLTVSDDGTGRLWDSGSARELCQLVGHKGSVRACAYARDSKTVLTVGNDGTARLWDVASGRELRILAVHGGRINACAYAPDGKTVLTAGDDGTARLWDVVSGRELRVLSGHKGWVLGCAYVPNGNTVLTAGADGTARLWNTADGSEIYARYAQGDSWLTVTPQGRWEGTGVLEQLMIFEEAEPQVPNPCPDWWIAPHWRACDLPQLRGLTPGAVGGDA